VISERKREKKNRDSTKKTDQSSTHIHTDTYTHIKHSIYTHVHTERNKQRNIQNFLVKLFSAAIFFICFKRFSKSKLVAILAFVPLADDGELLPELLLPELFKRLYVGVVVDGGDLIADDCRPSGVGELIRCKGFDDGNNFCVDFIDVEDS
jgi:hypothetical protein